MHQLKTASLSLGCAKDRLNPASNQKSQLHHGTPVPPSDQRLNDNTRGCTGPWSENVFRSQPCHCPLSAPNYLRKAVSYASHEAPGTIIIDPQSRFLLLVQGGGRALRYGIGVGGEGFAWSGVATIRNKQEWPDWYPPKEMIQRQPELRKHLTALRGGLGVAGGAENPLGARAMYLWQGNKDTLYRIHGTNEPQTIGQSVSSGCIRMLNQDIIDLYERTPLGAKVVVLRSRSG